MEKRIDSVLEFVNFMSKLESNGIEIPKNVTLEFDSPIFQTELSKLISETTMEGVNLKRAELFGVKITFKP